MSGYREHRRYLALRACWWILRGRSVAWNLNFRAGSCEALSGHGVLLTGCRVDGKPLSIAHLGPLPQEP